MDAALRSVGDWLALARRRLAEAGIADAAADARILVAQTLGMDRTALLLRAGDPVADDAARELEHRIARREAGEPVHRILGRRAFFDHVFALSPETLEPRPDTEILVDLAAAELTRRFAGAPFVFADIGTGSGAIAVSLLALLPASRCVAIDLSEGALRTARGNAEDAGVASRFHPLRSDYLAALGGPVDAVVSNPPYIESDAIAALAREVRDHDPRLALDGGPDGLTAYREIVRQAGALLRPGGDLFLEIGMGQGAAVRQLAAYRGFGFHRAAADLSGTERALWFSI